MIHRILFLLMIALVVFSCQEKKEDASVLQEEVQVFLDQYNDTYQELGTESAEAEWILNTRIVEGDTANAVRAEKANEAFAAFTGSSENIEMARKYLEKRDELTDLQIRQLEAVLYEAAANPETVEDIVKAKIKAETRQTEDLYGFDFQLDGESVSTNDLDQVLKQSEELEKRLAAWRASKEVGKVLKDGLTDLQRLRNETVQALDYDDYFDYQVSDYGMSSEELVELNKQMVRDVWPLYRELHTWARYTLAEKYEADVPELLPAHWLPNRWGQDWTALVKVEGIDLDESLEKKSAEWIVREGERFYVSLGFDSLPQSFYEKSSLYPLPEDADYKKNNHASAWHMNLNKDVRSLMSIVPNTEWWETCLHELGHIYYFLEYSRPEVPIILRSGANRAYHEALGTQIGLASLQKPLLEHVGLIPEGTETDETQLLLREALNYIVFIPWSAGVMTHFEHELYANNLPADQFNSTWWDMKGWFQGIAPPEERGEEYCDAASKTHINNDAAQYYDYAMSNVLLFQFHDYIAKNILNQDPHATNYYDSKEVGDFIKKIMRPGATVDWQDHLQDLIGTGMSAKPMVDYFMPLMEYLQEQNEGREHTLPEEPVI